MNKHIAAEYERQRQIFMRKYGTIHICGECIHTTLCNRMKVQNSRFRKTDKIGLLKKLAPFVTDFEIGTYQPKGQQKPIDFVKVYKCDKFVYDGGQE